ncbi:MAG: hypothetical protein KGH79_04850 [Patescibacteria group bacterium]|nr:hypothetical protein [Patescibacteria group bacterium]
MFVAAFTALGVENLGAGVRSLSGPLVDRANKGDKLAMNDPKIELKELAPASGSPEGENTLPLVGRDYSSPKEPHWPEVRVGQLRKPPHLRKARIARTGTVLTQIHDYTHDYTFEYGRYDPAAERATDVGVGIAQIIAVSLVPVGGPFVAMGIGTGRCADRETRYQLYKLASEDRRLRRSWSKENAETNVALVSQAVAPYCVPILGGFLRARDAIEEHNPLGVLLGLVSSVLDASIVAPIPSSVTLPLFGVTQAGPLLQNSGVPRAQSRAQPKKAKGKIASQ